jgi:uncharacterized membrane protein YkvA (DUF1232 family)
MALENWRRRARELRTQSYALYFAMKHPRVPFTAKLLAASVAAYAASPIDLIPDFIPVLGYLDDLIVVPLGIALVIRMIPPEVWADCRAKAQRGDAETRFLGRAGAAAIIVVWGIVAWWVVMKIFGE